LTGNVCGTASRYPGCAWLISLHGSMKNSSGFFDPVEKLYSGAFLVFPPGDLQKI
jgi:hypothetical protein